MKNKLLAIFLLLAAASCALYFTTGCSSLQQKNPGHPKPLYNYKADMEITIDGQKFDGMAVAALASPKEFTAVSRAKLDVLIVSSCQRYEKFEKVGNKWYGGSGRTFEYTYKPSATELAKGCALYLQAFDQSGLTDWGYIAFRTDEKLGAEVECNGSTRSFAGHSVCQSKAGLEQAIQFPGPVKYFSADESCNIKRASESRFTFRPVIGFCTAQFSDGAEFHSLTALGFDEVFVRAEKAEYEDPPGKGEYDRD